MAQSIDTIQHESQIHLSREDTCVSFSKDDHLERGSTQAFGRWQFRPDTLYLDNGAFGACPVIVSEAQDDIRRSIEADPQGFFESYHVPALKASKEALADFIHADVSGLVLVPGATYGLNTVIQSQSFRPADEILTTTHAYSSVRLALDYVARRDGAQVVLADIPFPVASAKHVLDAILAQVTFRTCFAVIDHISSRSGLNFPIKEIVAALASRRIDTLVDGAHVPGMIELHVKDINAAYYVANCHKWMCTPRGVGFLHVRADRIHKIKPLVLARSPHVVERSKHSTLEHGFDWLGTHDPSTYLSIPYSIMFLQTVIPGGHGALVARNHQLAVIARKIVCDTLGIETPCPHDMIGAMATIPLPDSIEPEQEGILPLQKLLRHKYGILVPVYSWPSYPKRVIRFSVQAHNTLKQYLRLAECLAIALNDESQSNLKKVAVKSLIAHCRPAVGNQFETAASEDTTTSSQRCPISLSPENIHARGFPWLFPYKDLPFPTSWHLYRLALSRISSIAAQSYHLYPLAVYPTAGEAETQFLAITSRRALGQANMEVCRIKYMLSCVTARRIPIVVSPHIEQLLQKDDHLEHWADSVEVLRNHTQGLIRGIILEMGASIAPAEFPMEHVAFVNKIVTYTTENREHNLSLKLWHCTLTEFANKVQRGCIDGLKQFLQIHAFLKDPIGGLRKDVETQVRLFSCMLNDFRCELEGRSLPLEIWEDVIAQLALETSFLAVPQVQQAVYVHFSCDQQLVYAYVQLDDLRRTEFSRPEIVLRLIAEMIGSNRGNCDVAPITVAYCYLALGREPRAIVIDGNNRATAVAFLRFIASHGFPEEGDVRSLRRYCQDHGLSSTWFVDIYEVLRALWGRKEGVLDRLKDINNITHFRNINNIPALITEEPCFHTIAITDLGKSYLQPVHQSIFADDNLLVALPAKKQLHGRSKTFKALPLK